MVQIVDARNPSLFRCEDLEAYVKEVDPNKENLVLVNKSDFLTEAQREMWAQYFRQKDIKAVFFSALSGQELDDIKEEEKQVKNLESGSTTQDQEDRTRLDSESEETHMSNIEECRQDLETLTVSLNKQKASVPSSSISAEEMLGGQTSPSSNPFENPSSNFITSSTLLSRSELIEVFRTMYTKNRILGKAVTIGLVGYPNVGKSSTINCLMQGKKVSVSATPGKTKHFQVTILFVLQYMTQFKDRN